MLHYSIGSENPAAHYFDVKLSIPEPDAQGQVLRLPAWIPGSYMIRDFAKNIVQIKAANEKGEIEMHQLDKSSWKLEGCTGTIEVNYRVYAWDLSVRSAHLDTTHGFFNGSSVFLEVLGQSDKPCRVTIQPPGPQQCQQWRLATSLSYENPEQQFSFEFGNFIAQDYHDLIDHPIEMGLFSQFDFEAGGIRHDVVLTGKFDCDVPRLKQDLIKICDQHVGLFGAPAPMQHYLFLVMVVGDGYGGLEHRSSTSLVCSRKDLPWPGQESQTDDYTGFLGLCSHEYFHSWNVKRIKPEVFHQPDLSQEIYTPLLWAFEGITSYYDDLGLVRSGLISPDSYLQLLAQTITRVKRGAGRKLQSAADSSFNAWTKFYKQDENSINAIVSYYAKGSLIALCIDLKIRQLTQGEKSLDDVMRVLWENYNKNQLGIREFEIQNIINQVSGHDLSPLLHVWIYQTSELPIEELLVEVAVEVNYRVGAGIKDKGGKEVKDLPVSTLGVNVAEADIGLKVVSVKENSGAQMAGLSAGDILIAINELKAGMKSYQAWLQHSAPGFTHSLHVFRRDELMRFEVQLQQPELDTVMLGISDDQNAALQSWLEL